MATAPSPPILVWTPGGGVSGGPISNPPIYSQADVTQLIQGQAYIDVVFGSTQTNNEWVLVACEVENTTDIDPLNIWPGIITNRTTTGFRLQLNGLPDSGNYYLQWAVSGINIAPSPATTHTLTGPTFGAIGVASTNFTVALPPSTTLAAPVVVTPSDSGGGGAFSPTFVTLTTGSPTQTFTYTPASYGSKTISTTNSGPLSNPASIVFTCLVTTYTFTGPTSGNTGVASTNFTVALPVGGVVTGTVTITPSSGGGGGSFTPTTIGLTTGAPSATFTYTPASNGTKTISVTNNGGLTDPGNISYVASTPFAPTDITGLKLWLKAETLALSDGASVVAPWTDNSGNGADFGGVINSPIYKTNIVNGKPVVRFNGTNQGLANVSVGIIPTNSTLYTAFVVASNASTSAGDHDMMAFGGAGGAFYIRRTGANLVHQHFTGGGYPLAQEVGGIVIGAWNVITSDWNGSNIHLWRNGTLKDTTGATTMGNAGVNTSIGLDYVDGAVNFADCDIAEVVVYNSSLSSTDRANVELYLKTKYGIP